MRIFLAAGVSCTAAFVSAVDELTDGGVERRRGKPPALGQGRADRHLSRRPRLPRINSSFSAPSYSDCPFVR